MTSRLYFAWREAARTAATEDGDSRVRAGIRLLRVFLGQRPSQNRHAERGDDRGSQDDSSSDLQRQCHSAPILLHGGPASLCSVGVALFVALLAVPASAQQPSLLAVVDAPLIQ